MKALPLALLLLSANTGAAVSCEWAEPGHNPYTGSRIAAILRMDLPASTRAGFIWESLWPEYDRVVIWRDSIVSKTGRLLYGPALRDMAFGRSGACDITRAAWPAYQSESAGVYRSGAICMVVPDVCGNPSWTDCAPAAPIDIVKRAIPEIETRSVPEPSALWLVLAALAALVGIRARILRGRDSDSH